MHWWDLFVAPGRRLRVWQTIVRKGDIVVDATCGNGHDTLALLKIVADESWKGCVYGIDIQVSALENTSSLLDESVTPKEKELVKLFHLCHSRMEDVIPKDSAVRLVAFNLGYLPGGDKAIITTSRTTLPALEAASRILESGGLLSSIVYVGHPGGRFLYAMPLSLTDSIVLLLLAFREEFETVQRFASSLPVETLLCLHKASSRASDSSFSCFRMATSSHCSIDGIVTEELVIPVRARNVEINVTLTSHSPHRPVTTDSEVMQCNIVRGSTQLLLLLLLVQSKSQAHTADRLMGWKSIV
ncbi:hypothetical protein ACLOJK_021466 [Asimina triloba]